MSGSDGIYIGSGELVSMFYIIHNNSYCFLSEDVFVQTSNTLQVSIELLGQGLVPHQISHPKQMGYILEVTHDIRA